MTRIGISTRVFLAFTTILAVFGTVLGYGVYRLHEVQSDTRLIHHSYVPLSLTISEAHTDLATYDAIVSERDKTVLRRVVQAQKVLYPFARRVGGRLARADEFIANGLARAGTVDDRAFLRRARSDVALLQSQMDAFRDSSEAFRTAVLADDWDVAFEEQQRLRTTVSEMQTTLRALSSATRAEISHSIGRADASERQALTGIVILTVVASVLAFLIMWLVHRTLRPIKELTEAARTLGRGEYSGRVEVKRSDEVGELADEFNRMADNIEARQRALRERGDELEQAYERLVEVRQREEAAKAELIKKERLAAIGRMTSQVTHELRNPLSSLGLNMELLDEEIRELAPSDSEAAELVKAVLEEIDRLTEITEEYLAYARLPVARLRSTDVNDLVRDLLGFLRPDLARRQVDVSCDLDADLPAVKADSNQLRRALLNLIRNAGDAMLDGGTVSIATSVEPSEVADVEGDVVAVTIVDTGPGIPAQDLSRIFDPFFSTKPGGTGLGLPLTYQIIDEHGGRILAASDLGKGTRFRIEVPVPPHNDDDRDGATSVREAEPGPSRGERPSGAP